MPKTGNLSSGTRARVRACLRLRKKKAKVMKIYSKTLRSRWLAACYLRIHFYVHRTCWSNKCIEAADGRARIKAILWNFALLFKRIANRKVHKFNFMTIFRGCALLWCMQKWNNDKKCHSHGTKTPSSPYRLNVTVKYETRDAEGIATATAIWTKNRL